MEPQTPASQATNAEAAGPWCYISASSCHHDTPGHPADDVDDPQLDRTFYSFELEEDFPDLGDNVDSADNEDSTIMSRIFSVQCTKQSRRKRGIGSNQKRPYITRREQSTGS
jgi:hypothetical protein